MDKGLRYIPKLFLQEADPNPLSSGEMKTAGHKDKGPRLVEIRRLMALEASP